MIRAFDLECCIAALERAREYAVAARLDHHAVSEIEHTLATAVANRDEDREVEG